MWEQLDREESGIIDISRIGTRGGVSECVNVGWEKSGDGEI